MLKWGPHRSGEVIKAMAGMPIWNIMEIMIIYVHACIVHALHVYNILTHSRMDRAGT